MYMYRRRGVCVSCASCARVACVVLSSLAFGCTCMAVQVNHAYVMCWCQYVVRNTRTRAARVAPLCVWRVSLCCGGWQHRYGDAGFRMVVTRWYEHSNHSRLRRRYKTCKQPHLYGSARKARARDRLQTCLICCRPSFVASPPLLLCVVRRCCLGSYRFNLLLVHSLILPVIGLGIVMTAVRDTHVQGGGGATYVTREHHLQ